MASPSDNLNPPPAPSRVFYSLGRMLGVEDFQADQDYHRGALARALLQVCGTGTVSGLNVLIPQVWQPGNAYRQWASVFDASQNVQVNTGSPGISSSSLTFNETVGGTAGDGPGTSGIVWTNYGPAIENGWNANSKFTAPIAVVDSNNNVQVLTAALPFISGGATPAWNTTVGDTTPDGDPAVPAWTCVGQSQAYKAGATYAEWAFVLDSNRNVQVNTGVSATAGGNAAFSGGLGQSVPDGILWTNYGPAVQNGWKPNSPYTAQVVIVDSNSNLQLLTANTPFTSGGTTPVWNTAVSGTTPDGYPTVPAWTCVGQSQLEIEVTAGLAIDRVGRMIESPSTVCILLQPWLASQTAADLTSAMQGGSSILVDVFATFVPCTQGVTPCFATQDDYDATDAFSANRLLDSFAMQLVLRTDPSPKLPQDPWLGAGAVPSGSVTSTLVQGVQQNILQASAGPGAASPFAVNGPTPAEYPPGFDASSVFLARISIPATAVPNAAPDYKNLSDASSIKIDNFSRLFLYPASLAARMVGLSSGAES